MGFQVSSALLLISGHMSLVLLVTFTQGTQPGMAGEGLSCQPMQAGCQDFPEVGSLVYRS